MKKRLPAGGLAAVCLQLWLATGPAGAAHAQQTCPPTTATTGNLLSNANFETVINCTVVQPRNMANLTTTKLCSWWDVNFSASDPYNSCATGNAQTGIAQYGVPDNVYGSQSPRSGSGYVGFQGWYYGTTTTLPTGTEIRSYPTTQLATPLIAGHTYYAEYWVSLSDASQRRTNSLGMALSKFYPGQPTDGLLTQVDRISSDAGALLNDRTGWQRVAGLLGAAGGEQYFTIGCFEPAGNGATTAVAGAVPSQFGTGSPHSGAYYYADDALLVQVPEAGPDFVAACGTKVTLPIDGTALPAGLGATYAWTSSTDPTFSATSLAPTITVPSTTLPTTYTLTISIPGQAPIRSATTMYVQCCYSKSLSSMVVITPGTYHAGTLPFQPNTAYYVPDDIVLTQGIFTLPASSTLYVAKGANLYVREDGTLELDGSRITAACDEMWGGIFAQNGGTVRTHLAAGGSRPLIAHSQYGVVFSGTHDFAFQFADTDFRFNYQGITFQLNAASRTGTIERCAFDSAPLGMLPPYSYVSATDFSHSFWHIGVLQSSQLTLTLTGNTFQRSMFGVYTSESVSPILSNNQFRNSFVAGLYTNQPLDAGIPMTGNQFWFPTPAVHDANPPQLATAYAQAPASATDESYGLLVNDRMSYSLQGNQFAGLEVLRLPDPVPAYRQVGISATTNIPSGPDSPRGCLFSDLYEGMRVLLKSGMTITENQFDDCVYGIHLVGPSFVGGTDQFQLQCNTFTWPAESEFGNGNRPRGIFIGPNYPVTLTGDLNPPSPGSATLLLKNYFTSLSNSAVDDVWNDSSNPSFNYDTFVDVQNGSLLFDPLTTANVTVSSSQGSGFHPDPNNDCAHDGYPNFGIQARGARQVGAIEPPTTSSLEPLAPNPAADQTVIGVHLTAGDALQPQVVLVRSLISGAIMREVALSKRDTAVRLNTQDLPNGVYLCTLVVNGRPIANRRLLINH